MLLPAKSRLLLTALPALFIVSLVGCAAERPMLESTKPTWSYRDGPTELSNNDLWEEMIPSTATAEAPSADEPRFASVEEPTR